MTYTNVIRWVSTIVELIALELCLGLATDLPFGNGGMIGMYIALGIIYGVRRQPSFWVFLFPMSRLGIEYLEGILNATTVYAG